MLCTNDETKTTNSGLKHHRKWIIILLVILNLSYFITYIMESGTAFSEQLRVVFDAMDFEKRGSVPVERFADLAKEHFVGTGNVEASYIKA